MLSDVLVAFDHLKHTTTVLANVDADGVEAGYCARGRGDRGGPRAPGGPRPRRRGRGRAEPTWGSRTCRARRSRAMVARIVEYVHAGRRVPGRAPRSAGAPPSASSRSRSTAACARSTPSPYMYFLDFEDFQLVGASPEPLLTVGRPPRHPADRRHAPRGADADEDLEIARDLLADEKERAEHVMLVDLGRNDLGRVCSYRTVDVVRPSWRSSATRTSSTSCRRVAGGCGRTSRRSTPCARHCRPGPCRARRRCARWRSSTSSSRSSAAPTGARSGTCR